MFKSTKTRMGISSYRHQLFRRLMAEPVLRRGTELQQRTINSLYPIAVRYNAALPKCFLQYKDYANSPAWEGTLKLQGKCSFNVYVRRCALKCLRNHRNFILFLNVGSAPCISTISLI